MYQHDNIEFAVVGKVPHYSACGLAIQMTHLEVKWSVWAGTPAPAKTNGASRAAYRIPEL